MSSFMTDNGLAETTAALVTQNAMKYIGWGTGSGQTVSSNDLATPANESRTTGTASQQTTTTTNDTYRVVGTITAGGSRAITEVGVFDAAGTGNPPSGGNMDIYGDFSVINLATGDSIAFTINAIFDQA